MQIHWNTWEIQWGVRRPYRVEYTPASAFRKHASPDRPDLHVNKIQVKILHLAKIENFYKSVELCVLEHEHMYMHEQIHRYISANIIWIQSLSTNSTVFNFDSNFRVNGGFLVKLLYTDNLQEEQLS